MKKIRESDLTFKAERQLALLMWLANWPIYRIARYSGRQRKTIYSQILQAAREFMPVKSLADLRARNREFWAAVEAAK